MGFYTQGIDANPTDSMLLEALLCNRAACNLELRKLLVEPLHLIAIDRSAENYGSVLRDCSKALTLRQSSPKAYYRSALALVALDRVEEAIDCCLRCQSFDPSNKGIRGVLEKATKAKAAKDKREEERQKRLQAERDAKRALNLAYRVRIMRSSKLFERADKLFPARNET
jgi:small subunit ribosomal protein S7e